MYFSGYTYIVKKLLKQIKKILPLLVMSFILIIFLGNKYFSTISCTNPFEVRDYTSSRKEIIKVCNDKLYFGSSEVVDKKDYQDIFEYKITDKFEPTQQHVRIFEQNNKTYVSIISIVNGVSWYKSAIGIYRENNNSFKLVFKKDFFENKGRYSEINFFSVDEKGLGISGLSISGDVGHLGCYGCLMEWTDYYDWDQSKQTFVLSNNKHTFEFNKLLEKYQNEDETACNDSDYTKSSITELYIYRKGMEKFCGNNAIAPFISSDMATMFLKAKKAIGEIISGKNISIKEVENIKLSD